LSERGDHGRRVPAGDLEKHHKAGMALDERCDVRVSRQTDDQFDTLQSGGDS